MENNNKKTKERCLQCYTCGAPITFDKNIRSKNDRPIPLNPDKTPHDCPNSKYNSDKRQRQRTSAVAAA